MDNKTFKNLKKQIKDTITKSRENIESYNELKAFFNNDNNSRCTYKNRNRAHNLARTCYLLESSTSNEFNKNLSLEEMTGLLDKYVKLVNNVIDELNYINESLTIDGFTKPISIPFLIICSFYPKNLAILLKQALMINVSNNQAKTKENLKKVEIDFANYINEFDSSKVNDLLEFDEKANKYFDEIITSLEEYRCIINLNSLKEYFVDVIYQMKVILVEEKESKEKVNENSTSQVTVNQATVSKVLKIEEIDPIYEYVDDNGIKKTCRSIEEFEEILKKSNVSQSKKDNYLKQMQNHLNQIEKQKYEEMKSRIIRTIFTREQMNLYNYARQQDDVNIGTYLEEIDILINMLIETTNTKDRKEIIIEIQLYMANLENYINAIKPKEEKDEIDNNFVLYFKDNNNVSYMEKSLRNIPKGDYKQVYGDINKILAGADSKRREVQGIKLAMPIYCLGREIKIFYTTLNDYVIFIAIIPGAKSAYREIINLVQRPEFINYYNDIKFRIENIKDIPNEVEYTNNIMNELQTSRQVRELVNINNQG